MACLPVGAFAHSRMTLSVRCKLVGILAMEGWVTKKRRAVKDSRPIVPTLQKVTVDNEYDARDIVTPCFVIAKVVCRSKAGYHTTFRILAIVRNEPKTLFRPWVRGTGPMQCRPTTVIHRSNVSSSLLHQVQHNVQVSLPTGPM
jgi:hypothetical protein